MNNGNGNNFNNLPGDEQAAIDYHIITKTMPKLPNANPDKVREVLAKAPQSTIERFKKDLYQDKLEATHTERAVASKDSASHSLA